MAPIVPHPPATATLRAWLDQERRTQVWLAEQIGVTRVTVASWLTGGRPSLEHALAIEALTGISLADWVVPSADAAL